MEGIMAVFHLYYKELYTKDSVELGSIERYFHNVDLTELGLIEREELEAPITMLELQIEIDGLVLGKVAGPDKLPLEVYRILFPL